MKYLVSATGVPASSVVSERRALGMIKAHRSLAVVTSGLVGEAGLPNVTRAVYNDGFTVDYEPIEEAEEGGARCAACSGACVGPLFCDSCSERNDRHAEGAGDE